MNKTQQKIQEVREQYREEYPRVLELLDEVKEYRIKNLARIVATRLYGEKIEKKHIYRVQHVLYYKIFNVDVALEIIQTCKDQKQYIKDLKRKLNDI